jgi:hypothetical protein
MCIHSVSPLFRKLCQTCFSHGSIACYLVTLSMRGRDYVSSAYWRQRAYHTHSLHSAAGSWVGKALWTSKTRIVFVTQGFYTTGALTSDVRVYCVSVHRITGTPRSHTRRYLQNHFMNVFWNPFQLQHSQCNCLPNRKMIFIIACPAKHGVQCEKSD